MLRRPERDIHAQVEPDLVELGPDFLEGGLAEVADVKSWSSVRLTRCRTVVMPSLSRQFVARTESSSSARLMSSLRSSSASIGCAWPSSPREPRRAGPAGLVVLHERVEVLAKDLGGLDKGHLGAEHAGRPDPQDQLVVVGPLADAGVLDVVLDADGPG